MQDNEPQETAAREGEGHFLSLFLVTVTALLSGCAVTPINYDGSDSGRFDDGSSWSYTGGKFADQKDGKGTIVWSSGGKFEGEWIAYKGAQRGTRTYVSGNVYTGQVLPNYEPHGKGRMEFKSSGCSYEGEWNNGKRHGQGIHRCPDGLTHTGHFRFGKPHGKSVTIWGDGQRYEGDWYDGKRHDSQAYLRYANGDEYRGPFKNNRTDGLGLYRVSSEGREYRIYNHSGTLMARIPIGSTLPRCAGAPAGWLLVQGNCGPKGLDGDVVLATPDGLKRFSGKYRDGAPTGNAELDEVTTTKAVKTMGEARGPTDFVNGQQYAAETGANDKGIWKHRYNGSFHGTIALRGKCLFRDTWEACEHAADGRRVDVLYRDRAAAEERVRLAEEAEERRQEAEEAARARREQEARDAFNRQQEEEGKRAMHQAIIGSLGNLQNNLAQMDIENQRRAQFVAQINHERARNEAQNMAESRERQAEAERRRQTENAQRGGQPAKIQLASDAGRDRVPSEPQRASQERESAGTGGGKCPPQISRTENEETLWTGPESKACSQLRKSADDRAAMVHADFTSVGYMYRHCVIRPIKVVEFGCVCKPILPGDGVNCKIRKVVDGVFPEDISKARGSSLSR